MNQSDILSLYPNLPSLQQSPQWGKLSMRERIDFVKIYQGRANLVQEPTPLAKGDIPVDERKELVREILANNTGITRPTKPAIDAIMEGKPQTFSLNITLNEMQQAAVDRVFKHESFCFTGAAGTGKTTAEREIVRALLKAGIRPSDIAVGAFTRVATGNIRKAVERDAELSETISWRIRTLHKHLEYEPEWWQDQDGDWHMRFAPKRNAGNLFDFRYLIIEESSMVDLLLYEKIWDAMRPGTVIIFIGDINQLPPVFGKSIFNYALHQLPVIELTQVYRQAEDSGIIQNAHRILDGQPPIKNHDTEIMYPKEAAKVKVSQARLGMSLGKPGGFFHKQYLSGAYNPETDVILSPWNKHELGTNMMNARIAQFLGDERKAEVFEIIAGRRKCYLALGDQVFIDKQLGKIVEIAVNGGYVGRLPNPSSVDLLRVGQYRIGAGGGSHDFELTGYENIDVDEIADEDKKNQASHIVRVKLLDDDSDTPFTMELQAAGDFAEQKFSLGYCLTVHKSQGCEWRKVYILLHEEHTTKGNFVSRELLYTACTRAREKLVLIAEDKVLEKGVKNQIIKGKTLDEKIAFINSGAQDIGNYPVLKPGIDDSPAPETYPEPEKKKPVIDFGALSKKPKVKFTDFSRFVSSELQAAVNGAVFDHWQKAIEIYGQEALGVVPTVTFDCQKANIVALANPATHRLKFNPVFLAAGSKEAQDYIIDKITAHEVCHLITARYVNQTGHGKDWQMSMKLMKQEPYQFYSGPALPDWQEACNKLMGKEVEIEEGELKEGEEE